MAKRVVILGAGYGGVRCGLTLDQESSKGEVDIVLVNKHNYHQFITQLHESAVGTSDDHDIRVPLDEIFNPSQVKIIKDEVIRIFPNERSVILAEGSIDYDYLVISLGTEPEYFEIPGLEQHSLTLRSLNSAKVVRTHIENNFAMYKNNPHRRELLSIVVGGAGFTGIELAGELAEWVPELAEKYDIPQTLVSVTNIESSSSILTGFDRLLVENAYRVLQDKGVRIITDVAIDGVTENEVRLNNGELIKTRAFIWTGGIRANKVVAQAGFTAAVRGRAQVNKYLQSVDYSNVYIIGDNAFIVNPDTGEMMAPTAQIAIQSGHVSALNILADIRGMSPQVFHPKELGRVVSLGRNVAVGKIGGKYRSKGRAAGLLKEAVQWKYLYSIGGLKLVARKLLK